MMENLQTIFRLKQEPDRPFLFLASGEGGSPVRKIGTTLGVCMYLCVDQYLPVTAKQPPKLSVAKAIRNNLFP